MVNKDRDMIYNYGKLLKEVDSIEFNNVETNIDLGWGSLMDLNLYNLLNDGWMLPRDYLNNKPNKSDGKSFYVVVFNIMKNRDIKDKNKFKIDLIYNYTQYNKIFLDLFYGYIIIQQTAMLIHKNFKIGTNYFFCIDEKLIVNNKLNRFINTEILDIYDTYINLKPFNLIDLFKFIVKGKLIASNNLGMSLMINHLFNKNLHLLILYLVNISGIENNIERLEEVFARITRRENSISFNQLSQFIFVVSDLKDFTHTIKNYSEEFKSLNMGSQKFRGSTSYLNNILNRLDKDFRDSMYQHNLNIMLEPNLYIEVNLVIKIYILI